MNIVDLRTELAYGRLVARLRDERPLAKLRRACRRLLTFATGPRS